MNKKNNFLLLSLEDDKAKQIANIVSNTSCKKILEYLTNNESTESEIAKKLNLPLSTVHYNINQLLESNLIEWNKYHYSEKGKEVKHYTVANKYIIIAPKGTDKVSLLDQLKNIIPTFLLGIIGVGASYFYLNKENQVTTISSFAMDEAAPEMLMMAKSTSTDLAVNQGNTLEEKFIYFIFGFISALIIYFIISVIRKKFINKSKKI